MDKEWDSPLFPQRKTDLGESRPATPVLHCLGQNFLLVDLQDFFSDLGSGTKKNALKMNSLLVTFRAFFFFLSISRKNSKTSKINQQSVLNL